jgi:hypothetical protein
LEFLDKYLVERFKFMKQGLTELNELEYEHVGRMGTYTGHGYDVFLAAQTMK